MSKAPAFQFYAGDFLIGTMGMSDEDIGVFIKMLCRQWIDGSLPNNQKMIKKLINSRKVPSEMVMHKFEICDDELLRNGRLEETRKERQAFVESRKENANKRWSKETDGNALAMHVHDSSICKTDALHLQSSSSTTIPKKKERADALVLPFDSADFKFFWENWEQHLKEKKKPLQPTAKKMQLAKLKEFGEQRAIAALKYSISGNCQGIYEGNESKPKPNGGHHKGIEEHIPLRNLMAEK